MVTRRADSWASPPDEHFLFTVRDPDNSVRARMYLVPLDLPRERFALRKAACIPARLGHVQREVRPPATGGPAGRNKSIWQAVIGSLDPSLAGFAILQANGAMNRMRGTRCLARDNKSNTWQALLERDLEAANLTAALQLAWTAHRPGGISGPWGGDGLRAEGPESSRREEGEVSRVAFVG